MRFPTLRVSAEFIYSYLRSTFCGNQPNTTPTEMKYDILQAYRFLCQAPTAHYKKLIPNHYESLCESLNFMKESDKAFVLDTNPLSGQSIIAPEDRTLVLEWMLHVIDNFNCGINTFMHSAILLDSYLSRDKEVTRNQSQFYGTCCNYISMKTLNDGTPPLDEVVDLCNFYTGKAIASGEWKIFERLDYRIPLHTPIEYIYLWWADLSKLFPQVKTLHDENYITEVIHFILVTFIICDETAFVGRTMGFMAASAVLLAVQLTHGELIWPRLAEAITGYSKDTLLPCAQAMKRSLETYYRMCEADIENENEREFCTDNLFRRSFVEIRKNLIAKNPNIDKKRKIDCCSDDVRKQKIRGVFIETTNIM